MKSAMGRKSAAKSQHTPVAAGAPPPSEPRRSSTPLLAVGIVLVLAIVGLFAYTRSGAAGPAASSRRRRRRAGRRRPAASTAKLGPHPQANLPPLPFQAYAPPRPLEVVRAAYQFAAEHPEVLSYVPCFCGCERGGHRGNDDCFVQGARRATATSSSGNRTASTAPSASTSRSDAMQMYALGRVSVRDIRAAIEKKWAAASGHTPTPTPHAALGCSALGLASLDPAPARYNPPVDRRAAAFARLFEAVHEGVYIGTLGPESPVDDRRQSPPQADLRLRRATRREADVRPFDRDRFVDPQARVALLERLTTDGSVTDYLLRLRRADSNAVWVELTARADPPAADGSAAHRSARPRRQRAQEARRRDARHLSPAAAGREDGGARPDDLRRRARAEQPAGHDPQLGRAAVAAADARRAGPPRPRDDPRANPSAPPASSATC